MSYQRKSRGTTILWAATVAFVVAVVWPCVAEANRARKASLAESFAIEDDQDVFTYPGLAVRYGQRYQTTLAFGETPTGAMLFGRDDDPVWGIGLNRSRAVDSLDGVDDLALFVNQQGALNQDAIPPGGEFATLLFALPSGVGFKASHTWHRQASISVTDGDRTTDSVTYNGLEFSAGWSTDRERNFVVDSVLSARMNLLAIRGGDEIQFESSPIPSVSLGGRGLWKTSEVVTWATKLALSRRNYAGANINSSLLMVRGGAGPRLDISNRVTAASTGTLGVASLVAEEPDADTRVSDTSIALPGWELAVDAGIREWLDLRWGLRSRFVINADQSRNTENDNRQMQMATRSRLGAQLGAGVNFWDFDFDLGASVVQLSNPDNFRVLLSATYAPSDEAVESPPEPLGKAGSPYERQKSREQTSELSKKPAEQGEDSKEKTSDQTSSESKSGASDEEDSEEVDEEASEASDVSEESKSSQKPESSATREAAFGAVSDASATLREAATAGVPKTSPRLYGQAEVRLESAEAALQEGDYEKAKRTAEEIIGDLEGAISEAKTAKRAGSGERERQDRRGGTSSQKVKLLEQLDEEFPEAVEKTGDDYVIVFSDNFAAESSDLRSGAKSDLTRLAEILAEQPDYAVTIEANASDEIGVSLRDQLAEARARTVREELLESMDERRVREIKTGSRSDDSVRIIISQSR